MPVDVACGAMLQEAAGRCANCHSMLKVCLKSQIKLPIKSVTSQICNLRNAFRALSHPNHHG